ncbi:MAG TPA: hypothetical protein VN130_01900 [Xanthobacteraceae bacterium]|nr:hypothetical protein [Xanthobacteraceae bacterium]
MTPDTPIPQNIWRFEVLLYISLLLDTLMALFRTMPEDMSEGAASVANFANAALILLFVFLVGLAARKRQNWARWVLVVALLLSLLSLMGELSVNGLQLDTLLELISATLTAVGLSYSFTGDARGWFDRAGV